MRLQPIIQYIFKYYRPNRAKLFVSLLCLTICYLSFEIVISFGSIIENNSQQTFRKYFNEAAFIISPPKGISFDRKGRLSNADELDSILIHKFKLNFNKADYSLIPTYTSEASYIVIKDKSLYSALKKFCNQNDIKILSSFYVENATANNQNMMYNVNGVGNRFNIFSFENQISAFVLGSELSSRVGMISRFVSFFSIVFTLYISLLYFEERKNEFSILIIQGYIDKNIAIIFVDCMLQNFIAFLLSLLLLAGILGAFISDSGNFRIALGGLIYILPYLPVLIIVQLLLLLSKSVKYVSGL